jgi:hypothetical protein
MTNSQNLKNSNAATGLNPQTKKKSLWWLWLLLVLIAIVIAIFCFKKCSTTPIDDLTTIVPADTTKATENTVIITDTTIAKATEATGDNVDSQTTTATVSQTPTTTALASTDRLTNAKKTIRGDFGNGNDRKQVLGNKYIDVQSLVNENMRNGNLMWDNIVE